VTRVPANPVGDGAVRALRAEGVRTDFVQRGGSRLGIYFAETGAKPARVGRGLRSRRRRGPSTISPVEIPWDDVLAGAEWFHVTGITPALGASVAEATREAIEGARRHGVRVEQFDLNYRGKLWGTDRAREVMRPLASIVDVIIANEEDIQACLGLDVHGTDVTAGRLDVLAYRDVAARVVREFGVKQVAITLRESYSASRNGWSAVLYDGATGTFWEAPRYGVTIVDRIGGGDSFAAGLIYGLASGRTRRARCDSRWRPARSNRPSPATSTA